LNNPYTTDGALDPALRQSITQGFASHDDPRQQAEGRLAEILGSISGELNRPPLC
jgi:hypothetical protein